MFFRAGAGGCCDCGDAEAWKEEGFCKNHRHAPGISGPTPEEKAIVEQVPQEVLELVINVACEALLHSTPDGFPMRTSDSEAMAEDEIFIACLFNDDVHDMDMVKSALVSATACSQSRANELMMAAHHNGHTEVLRGERAACHACQVGTSGRVCVCVCVCCNYA